MDKVSIIFLNKIELNSNKRKFTICMNGHGVDNCTELLCKVKFTVQINLVVVVVVVVVLSRYYSVTLFFLTGL